MAKRQHEVEVERTQRALGRRITALRAEAGLTQEGAAAKSGIDIKRWQRLEAGTVNATIRTLVNVAVALDTNFWDLTRIPPAGD